MKYPLVAFLCASAILLATVPACGLNNGSISGKFYNADGSPHAGEVMVYYKPVDPNVTIITGGPSYLVTTASGSYTSKEIPPADFYIWAETFGPQNKLFSNGFSVVNVKSRAKSIFDITLVPGGSIFGAFLGNDGRPVPDPWGNNVVILRNVPLGWQYSIPVAKDGTFSMDNILTGEYRMDSARSHTAGLPHLVIKSGKESHYDLPFIGPTPAPPPPYLPGLRGTVDLILRPANQTVRVGDTFAIDMVLEPNGQRVTEVGVLLDYDPAYTEATQLAAAQGSPLTIGLSETFDNAAGNVDFIVGAEYPSLRSSSFALATVTFRAKAATTRTSVSFSLALPRRADVGFQGRSVLRNAVGAEVTILDRSDK